MAMGAAVAFRERPWQQIALEVIHAQRDALPFVAPAWFTYLSPAYLLACLDAPREQGDAILHSLMSCLTQPAEKVGQRWETFSIRVAGFDRQQRDAVLTFLEFLEDADGGHAAQEDDRIPLARVFWEFFTALNTPLTGWLPPRL